MTLTFTSRSLLILIALIVSLAVTGCGSSTPPPTTHPDADIIKTAGEASGSTSGTTPDGKAIFASAGCAGCHTFAAAGSTGTVGPDLEEISQEGAAPIRDAIVDPDAEIPKGYKKGVMPTDFGTSLSKPELAALVAFIAKAGAKTKAGK
jgi:mono/diheme cytochrome c family protein